MKKISMDDLKAALERTHFNIAQTAEDLSITRQTVYNKLMKYGMKKVISIDLATRGMKRYETKKSDVQAAN